MHCSCQRPNVEALKAGVFHRPKFRQLLWSTPERNAQVLRRECRAIRAALRFLRMTEVRGRQESHSPRAQRNDPRPLRTVSRSRGTLCSPSPQNHPRWCPILIAFCAIRVGLLTCESNGSMLPRFSEPPPNPATTIEGHGFVPCCKPQHKIQTRAVKAQLKRSLPCNPERRETIRIAVLAGEAGRPELHPARYAGDRVSS